MAPIMPAWLREKPKRASDGTELARRGGLIHRLRTARVVRKMGGTADTISMRPF
ncbi:MAG: hypothetical protein MSS48_04200 [Clostridiales bacterium]|uniref:hypothetical protein n=1 Tax=Hornefia butyriciproducens TaxID=2652293 RepID=UPI0029F92160|nr:hypothetical protein [Hornefia butyriciproducens]MCI7326967.1 hypothetical protein [Clostridiales bacterium]MCI7679398.1 hypothetical protein [Clostridiales bacterium]MDD7020264.1 hypothetical protein [Hornefia butyriciproducens]MDY2990086.1 hypothetical protein [Hornefia butyriciproducens]MDY5463884.1 hypothetical protein [Hornefia butyriciproducens]